MHRQPLIFSGSSTKKLTQKICEYLNLSPGKVDVKTFSDGEIWVKFQENIRGRDLYIVQSTMPPSENLMELLIMLDAAKRASASRVTAVLPYFGYARQDRKDQPRVAITAKLVANLITTAGADRVITMDLHAAQIQGFFDIPFDHLYASPVFSGLFAEEESENLVVVSPDVGGIKLARSYAKRLNAGLVVIDKRRPKHNIVEVMQIIGDVANKNVLIVDDLIDTGGTFVNAVNALKERGALNVYGAVSHALLSGDAVNKINQSALAKLYVTDSIPLHTGSEKIVVRSASGLLAEAIIRSNRNESISSLFEIDKDKS
ncbi:MAG: ribose-phosphate pyrophosphokinase [Stygiobacter sp. RIFOXYC12_FULL_38_8]|nr:MAG: ribose-phosphate pyrophosphokinase [Stygiobacter sp. GWC2_38_9]OGV08111.1 MAG: ribose-phosphate pyrophosphokinase [Stygiobacter sp. RIFOXYB2_FULL_37_11]OGV11889.1 MAG: ribose-phosphate pyrophosphokinase [Stygiobacter sp. RIFOXYA2_FULL_38_8]OGV15627.1 MAG: ribose-phosphate pyrophosphokinase [Stygiobacter sp. RIFOXYC2_FULL_38_25]OGV23961.1 MAG: ribose-phosphate pyrophosphokinase [Stygiobacter sp. RIFOXYC12_FULL_38_8]OGV80741.1 MAG: ribose-phosphate pyrophosphokinase [Stygiobacter sp. GWF